MHWKPLQSFQRELNGKNKLCTFLVIGLTFLLLQFLSDIMYDYLLINKY